MFLLGCQETGTTTSRHRETSNIIKYFWLLSQAVQNNIKDLVLRISMEKKIQQSIREVFFTSQQQEACSAVVLSDSR